MYPYYNKVKNEFFNFRVHFKNETQLISKYVILD